LVLGGHRTSGIGRLIGRLDVVIFGIDSIIGVRCGGLVDSIGPVVDPVGTAVVGGTILHPIGTAIIGTSIVRPVRAAIPVSVGTALVGAIRPAVICPSSIVDRSGLAVGALLGAMSIVVSVRDVVARRLVAGAEAVEFDAVHVVEPRTADHAVRSVTM
jgi:hypothetical protein